METETTSIRLHKLQQIPVYALKDQLKGMLADPELAEVIKNHIAVTLKIQAQTPQQTIEYLNREQLILLIDAMPEISTQEIHLLFEEYRYGANPTFSIHLFTPSKIDQRSDPSMILGYMKPPVGEWNQKITADLPRVKLLRLERLDRLEGHAEVLEGDFHFQRRLDLIDADQMPVSLYETQYGFFWINLQEGYVILNARDHEIQHVLEGAISEAVNIHLTTLVITKELKNALPFLLDEDLRSSRLFDPRPESDYIRQVSLSDEHLSKKKYKEDWENIYPEVRTARYRIALNRDHESSLSIQFESGKIGLAGKISATEFRAWVLSRLSEIIQKVREFKTRPEKYVQTHGFRNVPELSRFTAAQKDVITGLISGILSLKADANLGYRETGLSPLELAVEMGSYLTVQYYFACREEGCGLESYLTCPTCGMASLAVKQPEKEYRLECSGRHKNRWESGLPLTATCENGHTFEISQHDLEEDLELFPSGELLRVVAEMVTRYIPDFSFSDTIESFRVKGERLYYHADQSQMPARAPQQTVIHSTIIVNEMHGGTITGTEIGRAEEVKVEENRSHLKKDLHAIM